MDVCFRRIANVLSFEDQSSLTCFWLRDDFKINLNTKTFRYLFCSIINLEMTSTESTIILEIKDEVEL